MSVVPISKSELDFTLQALRKEKIRTDGRALQAYRRFGIRFGAAHGEVEISYGPTRAMAVCSGEVVTPPPERPNEGRISFHVEYGSIASPSFDTFRPNPHATAVGNLVERLLKGSRAIDVEALCIVGGQKVWSIRVDIRALDDDGNLADVCCIAALCSLLHFRKQDVAVRGDTARMFSAEERVPVPLSLHHLPVPVTFTLFAPEDRAADPTWVLDANRLEEAAMGGVLCVCVNQHGELCGIHKPGGMGVGFSLIEQFVELASAKAKEIIMRIQSELEGDLAKRRLARRNVHQRFAAGDLLSVDMGAPKPGTGVGEASAPPSQSIPSQRIKTKEPDIPEDLAAELDEVNREAAELEAQLAAAEAAEGREEASPAKKRKAMAT